VLIAGELDAAAQPTFGVAVRAKLADAGASGERWTSWKDEDGWVVKLEFTANEVDHDARWSFDPRRSVSLRSTPMRPSSRVRDRSPKD
jgi:hypothetical protein